MTVKSLTAPTIAAALAEARQLYGDDVVLLESHPPASDRAARITIMVDAKAAVSPEAASISRVIERVKKAPVPAAAYGYAGASVDLMVEDDSPETDETSKLMLRPSGRPRGSLFPANNTGSQRETTPPAASQDLEAILDERLLTLYDRLSGIEKRFDGHPASAGKWLRHPLFNRLLDRGLRPDTVTDLFSRVSAADLSDDEAVFWSLARELRSLLASCASTRMAGAQIFVGPAGAGKTSMIMRLAGDKGYFGRRRCGVIIVAPQADTDVFYHDPTDLYRRHGIAVQNVSTPDDMEVALERLAGFDQVLIDTPAMPRTQRGMRDALAHLKPILGPIVPAQIHFVIDGTAALDEIDATTLRRLPLPPDAVCITRMDESAKPGRIAEWLREAALPVNVLGCGRTLSNSLQAFSPASFAEQLLER